MTKKARLQTKPATPKPTVSLSRPSILQRTCACGGVPGLTGECEACSRQRLSHSPEATNPSILGDRSSNDHATAQSQQSLLSGYSFGKLATPKERLAIQAKWAIGQSGDNYALEADLKTDQSIPILQSSLSPETQIQRSPSTKPNSEDLAIDPIVQLKQDPKTARQSRIAVATSVQSFRTTVGTDKGGQLTQRLLTELSKQRQSVADAIGRVGEGKRKFGANPESGEERAGITLGESSKAKSAPTHRAIVVGNGDYDDTGTMGHTVEPLRDMPEAVSEARTVASSLEKRGYEIRRRNNQTASQIDALLQAGIAGLKGGDELVFYYHGHGTPEGLIGRDGSVYTPAQMTALRSTARAAQVNLDLALEGCHTGVFADAIRGAELRDTRAAIQSQVKTASGGNLKGFQALLPMLDQAIALQQQKDDFTEKVRAWWVRRYKIEQQMNKSPDDTKISKNWDTHYSSLQDIWNRFATAAASLVKTLQVLGKTAGIPVQSPRIIILTGNFTQDGEQAIQAGLDDIDTVLNSILQATDARLR